MTSQKRSEPAGSLRLLRAGALAFSLAAGVAAGGLAAQAAETASPQQTNKTRVTLKLGTDQPIDYETHLVEDPPSIVIAFRGQRVAGALPERTVLGKGAIETIFTEYQGAGNDRYIKSLRIGLRERFPYQVSAEEGRLIIEIEHPEGFSQTAIEVGLRGGTVIESLVPRHVSARFRAMHEALTRASSAPAPRLPAGFLRSPGLKRPTPAAKREQGESYIGGVPLKAAGLSRTKQATIRWTGIAAVGMFLALFGLLVRAIQGRTLAVARASAKNSDEQGVPSSLQLFDDLVWQGFARQGYQLVNATTLQDPPGTFRVINKDGKASAMLCVGNTHFFEKQTVERFAGVMRQAGLEHGYLIGTGSFTIPAQRLAKEQQISLMGRDQVIELLSHGAMSEYVQQQLAKSTDHLEEAKKTIQQYATEVDMLRRQRNEASWYLGSERVKSSKLESRVSELSAQLQQHQTQLQEWEQEVGRARKQWDESQWYLGESRSRIVFFESQVKAMEESVKAVETVRRERDEAAALLSEERKKTEQMQTRLAELEQLQTTSAASERSLDRELRRLKRELEAIRFFGERRQAVRAYVPQARIEIRNGAETAVFAGSPLDLSSNGMRLEVHESLQGRGPFNVQLNLPGIETPLAAQAELVWEREFDSDMGYESGYRLITSEEVGRELERVIHAS